MADRSDQISGDLQGPDGIDPNSYNPVPLGPPSNAQGGLQEELGELGFPTKKPTISSSIPLGYGRFALPHVSTFASISNLVSRTYLSTFDEALLDNPSNALVMRRDPVIMEALWSRQVLCAQLEWHLEPDNASDSKQLRMAQELENTIRSIPRLQDLRMNLLEDTWYGRYGVQYCTGWDFTRGFKRLVVRDHMPVNGDKIVFRFSGQLAVLVHGAYRGPVIYTDRGRAHPLTPNEREQLILARYQPEDADYLEGEMAGKRFGVGMRSKVYWWWYQRNNVAQWMFDFLQTIGAGGLTIYYYEEGNPASYAQANTAANNQQTNQAILMPRRKGVGGGAIEEINKVERLEPSNAGAQLMFDIITKYYNDQIRSYIKGELLTTKAAPTGLGSNVAEQHAKTATRITKYDATRQQEYLTTDLVWPLQRHTYIDMPPERCPVRWVFDVEQPEPKQFLDAAKIFTDLGGDLDADQLRGVMGFRKPEPGSERLFNPQVQQQMQQAQQPPPQGNPVSASVPAVPPPAATPPLPDETNVNEPRMQQPDHPPVAEDTYGGPPTNNGVPPGGSLQSPPMRREKIKIRREKVPHRRIGEDEVLNIVKNSPQWKAKDEKEGVDWQRYADRFGVHGEFVKGTADPKHLERLIQSGELRPTKNISREDVEEKKKTGDIHGVVITREPGKKLLVVDGNHSLRAAIEKGMRKIPATVAEREGDKVLSRKRVRHAAEKSAWQHYFAEKGNAWQHTMTGEIRYQKERPSEWEDKLMVNYSRPPYKTQSHELGWDETPEKEKKGPQGTIVDDSINEPSWSGFKAPITNAKKEEPAEEQEPAKLDRSSFGYIEMPPGADPDAFAQCESCTAFTGKTCLNFSPKDKVKAGGSCNYYVYGRPRPEMAGEETSSITPQEADYVERPTRCENCFFQQARATRCGLYEHLNESEPDRYSLDVNIKPTSCCNAQSPSMEEEYQEKVKTKQRKAKKGLRLRLEKIKAETKQSIDALAEAVKKVADAPQTIVTLPIAELTQSMDKITEKQTSINEALASQSKVSLDQQRLIDESVASQKAEIALQNTALVEFQKQQRETMESLVKALTTKKRTIKRVHRDADGLITHVEEEVVGE